MTTVPMAMAARRQSAADARELVRRPMAEAHQTTADRRRVPLCGIRLDSVGLTEAASRLEGYLVTERLHQVVAVNLDCLRIAQADATFRETIDEADMVVADGMPLVWASRLAGSGLPERVTGNALVDVCCRLSATTGGALFLLGGRPGVAEQAARTIRR